MKQKDIALIAVVIIISAVFSIFISKFIFGKPAAHNQSVEVIGQIQSEFTTPSTKYFNANSIDPVLQIQIGNNSNTAPFGSGTTNGQ